MAQSKARTPAAYLKELPAERRREPSRVPLGLPDATLAAQVSWFETAP